MGNSLRHSLGHMCGAEASKDLRGGEEGEQPVDRPKESKKKSKKSKKNKKVRNGKLGPIKEENELQTENLPNGKSELPSVVEEDLNESQKHEDIPEEEIPKKDELQINDESSTMPIITVDCVSDTISAEEDEKTVEEVSSDLSRSYVNKEETDGNIQGEGDNISLISTYEEEPNIMVCTFKPIKTEVLGIEEADDIFRKAFTNYELFLDGGNKFQDKILEFQEAVECEKKSKDFLTLWHEYKVYAEESINNDSVDKIDMSNDLKAIESTGLALTEIIENVKPILDKCADDAENIDAIKCATEQMLEGEELMTTDKFSAPGKYRRNMNRLKKCTKHINEIELETSEILRCLQVYSDHHGDVTKRLRIDIMSLARESIIIPDEKNSDRDLEDIFSNLSQESIPIALSDCDENSLNEDNEDRPSTPIPPVDFQVRSDDHLSNDSHSDHDVNDVFVKVQCESDDDCQDSIHVSTEISNSMELDFDIISPSIQVPIDTIEKTDDEDVKDSPTLPQVHFDSIDQTTFEQSVNGDTSVEIIHIENIYDVECIPDIPECSESSIDETQEPDPNNLTSSDSTTSYNSLTIDVDCQPDSEVSSINIEYQSPPLSEDIIGIRKKSVTFSDDEMDDHCVVSVHDVTNESNEFDHNKSHFEEIFNTDLEPIEITTSVEIVESETEQSVDDINDVSVNDVNVANKTCEFDNNKSHFEEIFNIDLEPTEIEIVENETEQPVDDLNDVSEHDIVVANETCQFDNNKSHFEEIFNTDLEPTEIEIVENETEHPVEDANVSVHNIIVTNETSFILGDDETNFNHVNVSPTEMTTSIEIITKNETDHSVEHRKVVPEYDVNVTNEKLCEVGKGNKTNFEEIFITNIEQTEQIEIEIIVENESEQVEFENSCNTPLLEPNIEHIDLSISSSIEDVESYDPPDQQTHVVIDDVCESKDSAIESDKLDTSVDYININEYQASTPRTTTHDESGVIMSDIESENNEDNSDNIDDNLLLSDSCEEIKNEMDIIKDTTVISFNNKSGFSPELNNISNAKLLTFEEIHIDHSDSECNSDATSIQEIQILSVHKPRNNTCKTNDILNSNDPLSNSDSTVSPKGINNSSTEEVDVALKVLKEAISNDDIQDEFVDLLCSSISRVLGDENEKSTITKLKSIESSHSSYEENSVHKSFQLSKEVIDWVGTHFQSDEYDNEKSDDDETEQCIIVPVGKGSVHSPHIISHTIFKSEKNPMKVGGDLVKTVNVSVEDITADESIENNTPENELVQTFVIKSVPETSETGDILSPLSSPLRRCHTPPLELDLEPDHNTLDYGNYVFIDPSTGDIQVMRNRSRSLDSLVSMTSSRSSISRFGSFEFVTDFEINIAEKNQEMMKGH